MQFNPNANRYNDALSELHDVDLMKVEDDLGIITDVLKNHPQLLNFFYSPKISVSEKKRILKKAFSGKIGQIAENLLMILVDKNREEILGDILFLLRDSNDERNGRVHAEITVARETEDGGDFDNTISEAIIIHCGQFGIHASTPKVIIHKSTDTHIMGGIIVRIGDYIWDASVNKYLNEWKKRVAAHKLTKYHIAW